MAPEKTTLELGREHADGRHDSIAELHRLEGDSSPLHLISQELFEYYQSCERRLRELEGW